MIIMHFTMFLICSILSMVAIGATNELLWRLGILKQGDLKEALILTILSFLLWEILIYN